MTKCTEALRLKEALNNMWGLHHGFSHKGHLNRDSCPATSCHEARSAIDAFLAAPSACDAEKAVLVAALEDARMLCMNDHAYDNETSQVFEAVQVINRALADRPPAAAALLPQGRETE